NGIEQGSFATIRPAPTGVTFRDSLGLAPGNAGTAWNGLASGLRKDLASITLDELNAAGVLIPKVFALTSTDANPIYIGSGANNGVLEVLGQIRDQVNSYQASNPTSFFWSAAIWGQRLALINNSGDDNAIVTGGFAFTGSGSLPTATITK